VPEIDVVPPSPLQETSWHWRPVHPEPFESSEPSGLLSTGRIVTPPSVT